MRRYFLRLPSMIRSYSQCKDRLLVTFDFDRTIINKDCYEEVYRLVSEENRSSELEKLLNDGSWIKLVNCILHVLQRKQSYNIAQISKSVRLLPPVPGMIWLIRRLHRSPHTDICILSDANCYFINEWLVAHGLKSLFHGIYTNPAVMESDGNLVVKPFEEQTHCKLCPKNLCKGSVMTTLIEQPDVNYTRAIYIGDSCNDLCAIRALRPQDVACVRRGEELHGKLPAHQKELCCDVTTWSDGHNLEKQLISKGFNL